MNKTPDQIRTGLECCQKSFAFQDCGSRCPYYRERSCGVKLYGDALALIQQLQAENAEKDARIQQLEAELSDAKNNHQHTIDIAERQKSQIDKLKNVVVRLNTELEDMITRYKIADDCAKKKGEMNEKLYAELSAVKSERYNSYGHAGPGIRDNY